MAKGKKQVKSVDKWKKKRWFKINAPKLFKEQQLGETVTADPNSLVGRTITVNMATLTGSMRTQNTNITFEIIKVQGDLCQTNVKSYDLIPATIKRKIKKGKTRIDDSFTLTTKDKINTRIKPMIVTDGNISAAVKTLMRKRFIYDCKKIFEEKTWNEIILEILTGNLSRTIKKTISKIYPVRFIEMRKIIKIEGNPVEGEETFTPEKRAIRPRRNFKDREPYVKPTPTISPESKESSPKIEETKKPVEEKPVESKVEA